MMNEVQGNKMVMTWRKDGKRGNYMSRRHYEMIRFFIFSELSSKKEVTLVDLLGKAQQKFFHNFDLDIGWHLLKVKQDLEARGLIENAFGVGPQRIQIIKLKSFRNKNQVTSWPI